MNEPSESEMELAHLYGDKVRHWFHLIGLAIILAFAFSFATGAPVWLEFVVGFLIALQVCGRVSDIVETNKKIKEVITCDESPRATKKKP